MKANAITAQAGTGDWAKIAAVGEKRSFDAHAAQLRAQLDLERKAHTETLKALDAARLLAAGPLPQRTAAKARPRLKGDKVEVIFGDVHGHHHDPDAFAAMLGDLTIIRPDRIVIGGDFMDCGGFLAEHHTLGYVAESEDSYEMDMAISNRLLTDIQEAANDPEVDYIEGNHEWRVERWALTQRLAHHKDVELLRRTFCAEHVLRLKDRGVRYFSMAQKHDGLTVPGTIKRGKLYLTHKLAGGSDAAESALKKMGGNVVFFDTHRATFKPRYIPHVGQVAAWNPGCLCKRQPTYANTNPTGWTHGYLVRFIAASGAFQMVNMTIADGVSFGGLMLKGTK